MAIKDEMNTEKQKLKNMTWKDRLWYINAYYRFHIIACILVIFLLITVGQTLYRKTFTTRLYISIINDKTQSAYTETLDALLQQGLDFGPKDLLEMDSSLYLSFDEQNMSQYHYASIAKLTALLASNTLDLVIADQEFIENYGKQAAFLNLEENLDSELYGQLSEDILEVKDEKGQTCPAAISLEHSILAEETGIDLSSVYIAVIRNSAHREDCLGSIECLFP